MSSAAPFVILRDLPSGREAHPHERFDQAREPESD
jgi:hypothetical protein